MYYWVCQKCDLKVWGAENCWCGINREQNSALAEQKNKRKGNKNMDKHYVIIIEWANEYGCEHGITTVAVTHTLEEAKEIFAKQVIEEVEYAEEQEWEIYEHTDETFDAGEPGYYSQNHTYMYIKEVGA